ncbi:MAG TPA: AMP-binding protein [Solirubrobacteraceae bacterium]|nr:AMP-binding protein [Solirubrobacteraceae bacterium]
MLVDAWLPRAAAARPGHPAVNALTYVQLDAAAADAARRLAARGAAPGARVGIALAPGEPYAIALHACLRLGAVAVPLDLRLPAPERARRAAGCAVVVDAPLDDGDGDERAELPSAHDLDAPAIVVFTSGTSGASKPVALTYGNWLWSALGSAVALGCPPGERWLCALPLTHVGGLSILLRSVIAATTAIVHERFETGRVLAELRRADGPTVVSLVPTTLARLLDAGLRRPPALRWALLGGAAIPAALTAGARRAGVPLAPTYGLTEACSQVVTNGAPLFCTRVELAPDGEILVSGPTVAPGSGPVLRTGDLGRRTRDGALEVVGRKADTIVTGGENVAPTEVEDVLLAHPAVADAAVHGRPDPEWGEAVVATVVLRPGARADAPALRRHCAARLAGYQVPKEVTFATALPRTASGKLLRGRLA